MGEIHCDDTYLNQFGHFLALFGIFGVKMAQNVTQSPEWLEQVGTNVGTGWSPS